MSDVETIKQLVLDLQASKNEVAYLEQALEISNDKCASLSQALSASHKGIRRLKAKLNGALNREQGLKDYISLLRGDYKPDEDVDWTIEHRCKWQLSGYQGGWSEVPGQPGMWVFTPPPEKPALDPKYKWQPGRWVGIEYRPTDEEQAAHEKPENDDIPF